jgi:hypothetical protein
VALVRNTALSESEPNPIAAGSHVPIYRPVHLNSRWVNPSAFSGTYFLYNSTIAWPEITSTTSRLHVQLNPQVIELEQDKISLVSVPTISDRGGVPAVGDDSGVPREPDLGRRVARQHAVAEDKPFKRGARMIDHFQECFRSLKVPVE